MMSAVWRIPALQRRGALLAFAVVSAVVPAFDCAATEAGAEVTGPALAPPTVAPPAVALPAAVTPIDDPQAAAFDGALSGLLSGDRDEATARLRAVVAGSTDPERRRLAALLLQRLDALRSQRVVTDPQEGRTALLATTTGLGLAFYGWGLPSALDLTSDRATVGTYLVTAGASFVVPFFATRSEPVSWGVTNLAFWGGTRGGIHGLLLSQAIEGRNMSYRSTLTAAMLLSAAEMAGGALYARYSDMSAGDAHLLGVTSDLTAAVAAGGTATWMLYGDYSDEASLRTISGLTVAGAVGGMAIGNWYRGERQLTWGDAEFLRTSALLGAYAGVNALDWAGALDEDFGKAVPACLAAATVLGFAGGDLLGQDQDFRVGQALLIDLGTLAGGFVSAGLAYLISDSSDASVYLTSSLLGAGAGYGLLYWAQARPSGQQAQSHGPLQRVAQWLENHAGGVQHVSLSPWRDQLGAQGLALGGRF